MSVQFETITVDVDAPRATITMNRPDRYNAMNIKMAREVTAALELIAADDSVRVVVLTGAGRSFCPGADIKAIATGQSRGGEEPGLDQFQCAVLLHELPVVTIAVINGACAGAGLTWATACDLRVATRSARFNTAFLTVGVAGDMGGPWTISRLVGGSRARELFFLPEKFTADEAREWGLVNRVFDDETFRDDAEAVIARLCDAAPAGLITLKKNFVDAERLTFPEFVDIESRRHLAMFELDDTREAFAARAANRPPAYGER